MNENIKAYLVNGYNKLAYTHNYVFGYVECGMVYGAIVKNAASLLDNITTLDRASSKNGGTYSLKYKPNKAMLALIKSKATAIVPIMTEVMLEKMKAESNHNRGQIFEDEVAKVLKAERPKCLNAKFTECGDIIIDFTHYQVKYLKATFTDELTLRRLGGR